MGTSLRGRHMYRMGCIFSFLAAPLLLSGCQGADGEAFGPAPVLNGAEVRTSVDNRALILASLMRDAGGPAGGTVSWYEVTRAGFNFVDDQCTTYFNTLFKLRRKDDALKSGLTAFNATSNAILGVTGSSILTMTAVAQAFNLSYKLADIHSDTFLYNLPPSETSEFVNKMQRAYRDGVALNPALVANPTESYHRIQEYLSLCLPQTIEARLVEHVADARAEPTVGRSGTEVGVIVGSAASATEKARLERVSSVGMRLPAVTPPPNLGGAATPFERQMGPAELGAIQEALCVKVDRVWGAATRAALVEFYNGVGDPRPRIAQSGMTGSDMVKLREAMRESPRCNAPNGHKSAFELGKLVG